MPKPQKVAAVKELKERLEESNAALLTEFRGLKVAEMKELRRDLAEIGGQFKVVKNTLSRIAAKEAALDDLLPLLEGSTAIAFIDGDPIAAAKSLDELSKKYPALVIKGGLMDGKVFGAEQAQALAKVKPREVLLAQLAGLLQSPIQALVNLLQAPVRDLGYVLAAYRQKLEAEGPSTAAAEPAAEEQAPAEEPSPAPETGTHAEAAGDSPEEAAETQGSATPETASEEAAPETAPEAEPEASQADEPKAEAAQAAEPEPEAAPAADPETASASADEAEPATEAEAAPTEEAKPNDQDQQPANGEG